MIAIATQILDLSKCSLITDDSLAALGGGCPRLTNLNLNHCSEITCIGIKELAAGCQQLQELHLVDCDNLDNEVCVCRQFVLRCIPFETFVSGVVSNCCTTSLCRLCEQLAQDYPN